MCIAVKYGIWKTAEPEMSSVNALVGCGYHPLTAMVLASRGIENERQAHAYLGCDAPLCDPFLMKDMAYGKCCRSPGDDAQSADDDFFHGTPT